CSSDHLRTGSVLRPSDGIDDRGYLRHIAVFTNRGKQICYLQELLCRYAGNLRNHLGGVPRIVFLKHLKNAARVLKRKIVGGVWRQHWRWFGSALSCCSGAAGSLVTAAHRTLATSVMTLFGRG